MTTQPIFIRSSARVPALVRITTADGAPIWGVTRVQIDIDPAATRAVLTIDLPAVDIAAHPLLSLATLVEAASFHGLDLVPRDGADRD